MTKAFVLIVFLVHNLHGGVGSQTVTFSDMSKCTVAQQGLSKEAKIAGELLISTCAEQ